MNTQIIHVFLFCFFQYRTKNHNAVWSKSEKLFYIFTRLKIYVKWFAESITYTEVNDFYCNILFNPKVQNNYPVEIILVCIKSNPIHRAILGRCAANLGAPNLVDILQSTSYLCKDEYIIQPQIHYPMIFAQYSKHHRLTYYMLLSLL